MTTTAARSEVIPARCSGSGLALVVAVDVGSSQNGLWPSAVLAVCRAMRDPSLVPKATESLRWTLSGFLDQLRFVHTNMRDHAYAWVLGAGASKSSGIPLAGDLAHRWLGELHRRLDVSGRPLAEWATDENLGIPDFEYKWAASFYSRIYERRFGTNPEEGYAYLEALMSGKEPSPGYSILAQVLDRTQHNVVISTNFDNLVADALSIYTETFPLVIGHESLANFVRVVSRRPVICKIHRDLLLAPKNDHRSLRRLHESWAAALRTLFSRFTPVFIGYGGNDDSLMDLLESLDPEDIKGQLIWCYHERFEPSARIVALVQQHRGALVAVPDFDLLMVLVGNQMGLEPIDDAIEKRAAKRARQYRERLIALDTTTYPDVQRILRGAFERAGGTLAWHEKILKEVSTERRVQLYEQALEQYPDDPQLQLDFANLLRWNYLDVEKSLTLLAKLQANDRDFDYAVSFGLADLQIDIGRLDDAAVTLGGMPESELKQCLQGIIWREKNDVVREELACRTARTYGSNLAPLLLYEFLVAHGRIDEGEAVLREALDEEDDMLYETELALLLWCGRGQIESAGKMFAEFIEPAESEGGPGRASELGGAACFFLAHENLTLCRRALDMLEICPTDTWTEEVRVQFVRLVHAVLTEDDEAAHLYQMHKLLGRSYIKIERGNFELKRLVAAVDARLPKGHRKFLAALAEAVYDPAQRSALNSFPQWRASGTE